MNVLTQPGCEVERPAKAHAKNLETLKRAFAQKQVCLMECKLTATGEVVAVLCAVQHIQDETLFTPFAVMLNGNPYEMLLPPDPAGGFFEENKDHA